jgi:hypothetical protein
MDQDFRKESRLNTHIVTELATQGSIHNYCGYIENLSKEGIGILSLDTLKLGEKVTSSFYLTGVSVKISPNATVIHSEKGAYNLFYYGLKFDDLTEKESKAIEEFMAENNLNRTA